MVGFQSILLSGCVLLRQEAVVISGKKLARQIRDEARSDVEKWMLAGHRRPHLSVILVGDNPASHSYVLNKTRSAADVGEDTRGLCTQDFHQLRAGGRAGLERIST